MKLVSIVYKFLFSTNNFTFVAVKQQYHQKMETMMPISRYKNWNILSDPAIVKEVCTYLKQMRLSKNWSQSQLAEHAGLDRVTISRMENGRAATLLTIVQILRALDKLYVLNTFNEEPEVSPLQMLREQESQRLKASPKKKTAIKKQLPK
ncbi:MAG: helix-turn-helix transcriptional regulator [Bacteroidia bacterium]